jgi:RNA polymerase sigma-70 factor (ECF subfamily)
MPEVTQLLTRLEGGDKAALDEIIPLVYQELPKIARVYLNRDAEGHTLQPTALIHEAFISYATIRLHVFDAIN